jgi:type IV secretory pathway TraG/TraD family ATPase VirD4
MHSLLTQISSAKEPVIVVDQTGEMVARYYTPERGDIILNPLDDRGVNWDLFKDLDNKEAIEKFAKILFSYARSKSDHNSDPFWEESAQTIFVSCAEYLQKKGNPQISELIAMLTKYSLRNLAKVLKGTSASKLLEDESKSSSSILSVLATYSKPLSHLKALEDDTQSTFSLKDHFANIKNGKNAWLFLSTKPSARILTLPLISCFTELALTQLIDRGISSNKVWFILDELPSLGRLPALSLLMTEGRKYGAAVIASLQSLNQLYGVYGNNKGSTIFGQFGSSFFFRNTEPTITKMISTMCGFETITKQKKNISFGANELRDGISYGEVEQRKNLVEENDIANLGVGECYALLPEPKVRLAKITVPYTNASDKSEEFVQVREHQEMIDASISHAHTDDNGDTNDEAEKTDRHENVKSHKSKKVRSKNKNREPKVKIGLM